MTSRVRIIKHEAVPQCGSFEVRYPDAYSTRDLKSLRSRIERERDQALENAKSLEERWKKELNRARHDLQELNEAASSDTPGLASHRAGLHVEIAAGRESTGTRTT